MTVRLKTPWSLVGYEIAARLEEQGVSPVTVQIEEVETYELRHAPDVPAREVVRLLKALPPFQPAAVRADPDLSAGDIELTLGEEGWPGGREVVLYSDSSGLSHKVREQLAAVGLPVARDIRQVLDDDVLIAPSATPLMRQLIRWLLAKLGVTLLERNDAPWEESVQLVVRDPLLLSKPWIERTSVRIGTDDPEAGNLLAERLTAQGFRCDPVAALSPEQALAAEVTLEPGPFARDRARRSTPGSYWPSRRSSRRASIPFAIRCGSRRTRAPTRLSSFPWPPAVAASGRPMPAPFPIASPSPSGPMTQKRQRLPTWSRG